MRIFLCFFISLLSILSLTSPCAIGQQQDASSESIQAQPVIKIDLKTLSPEVLKCNVCRMRLGLVPIPGGGTLDAAEHDAQAQKQALQAADPIANTTTSQATPSVAQPVVQAYVEQTTNNPLAPAQKRLEGHNLESQSTLAPNSANKLEQFNSPSEATKFSSNELSSATLPSASNTRLNSPTAMQIELELAKRQLADRNAAIETFNKNQIQLESKIAELTIANKQYASSLSAQSVTLQNLNTQLSQQATDSASRLSQVQQELDSTKRELSVAVANQKQSTDELSKSTNAQVADLSTRLKNAENKAEELKGQADTLRRQRDGFQRELQNGKESPTEKTSEDSRDMNVMQGLLEKTQRELGEVRTTKDTLEKKVSELEQQVSKGQTNAEEVSSLRVQLEQQAAKLLASEAAWDVEKAELLKKIPKSPAIDDKQPAKVTEAAGQPSASAPTLSDPAAATQAADKAEGQSTDASQTPKDVKDDSPSSPFKAGPKMKSRAPRQPKDENAARREL